MITGKPGISSYDMFATGHAIRSELRPNTASIVCEPKKFIWEDKNWIAKRKRRNENRQNSKSTYTLRLS